MTASRSAVWTVPNLLSFARLALLPVFAWLLLTDRTGAAIVVLAVLGSTDWLDGYLARRLGQVTLLGERLDPLADRISVIVVGLTLAWAGLLPWLVLAVIVAVDATLLVLAWAWFRGSPDLPVTRVGKLRTLLLLLALPMLLLADAVAALAWLRPVGLVLAVLGALGHVLAGVGYARGMARSRRL
ncbi:CDP-alcohol phosphatidyltransferase [Beutenbergia cavernae DSM 12333]|uniref:CDP-alcohol phosphatidyltransferase n=1 Tax=Beutenbergia cavernae (strain ATCC BAA-8 / DSM 12333 / CCUG 43141 / JCM 11478 / NBRC 16432 / NCIMB 13614 / HKI 0122) TaxID=471853 RepID=C5BVU6_BEUC1|nr:CDP-alcohol phosphatidyltransferase family protein [Beutenbergia cavernae]ACQ80547.1 CDP-alcohol phosphatidyltransferase [Beutenbergia cavernae DSM 12333]